MNIIPLLNKQKNQICNLWGMNLLTAIDKAFEGEKICNVSIFIKSGLGST